MPTALITGASRGLGGALAAALAGQGWDLVLTARDDTALQEAAGRIRAAGRIASVAGDIRDAGHRRTLTAAVEALGGLDLLVNNASDLGATPLPRLVDYPVDRLPALFDTNVVAPLALLQSVLPQLRAGATVINVTSDAAVEPYEGWGGYGASKAALDQLSAVLAVELPQLHVYAFDPGDMRTQMHQDAFPGADISDRPEPQTVVPAVLRLLETTPLSGRYRAADLLAPAGSVA
jgi:NAD(P)-dependent dehydrogenase (short-subunit alcohol dehydrogenase family)